MGFVVAGITIPLIIVECFLLASTWASKKNLDLPPEVRKAWTLIVSDKLVFLLQKIIQAIIYCSVLRYKTFRPRFIENAKFYLKVFAFFNFIEWIDSQLNEDSNVQSNWVYQLRRDPRGRIMRLVPVFTLETNNQTNSECLPKFVQTHNASSSIKTANNLNFKKMV